MMCNCLRCIHQNMEYRFCSNCKNFKPKREYSNNSISPIGLLSVTRGCTLNDIDDDVLCGYTMTPPFLCPYCGSCRRSARRSACADCGMRPV